MKTLPELLELAKTDEGKQQICVIIAELAGWRFVPSSASDFPSIELKAQAIMCWVRPGNENWQAERIPNYTEDLNAAHEIETRIINYDANSPKSYPYYIYHLEAACETSAKFKLITATALQRCIALILTMQTP